MTHLTEDPCLDPVAEGGPTDHLQAAYELHAGQVVTTANRPRSPHVDIANNTPEAHAETELQLHFTRLYERLMEEANAN